MKIAFSNRLVTCLAAIGFLTIAPAAFGQTDPETQTDAIGHLTCVKNTRGTCKTQAPLQAEVAAPALTTAAVPNFISSIDLELFSNILLGVIYFGLPVGLGLAIFLRDKQDDERSKRLNAQIELLERLWSQHPQH